MLRRIKTGLDVSKQAYKNQPGHPQIKGEIQGKRNVASLWTMTSSILLFAHAIHYAGIVLPSVIGKTGIQKNNDAYTDDVDTWAGSMDYG